jgi:hypothetical protein
MSLQNLYLTAATANSLATRAIAILKLSKRLAPPRRPSL